MLADEAESLRLARKRAMRRASRKERAMCDTALAGALEAVVKVGDGGRAVGRVGAPVSGADVVMATRGGRIRKKSKKATERSKKIRKRALQRAAMTIG